MDEDTSKQAMDLLRESKRYLQADMEAKRNGEDREIERIWVAFFIFSANKLGQVTNPSREKQKGEDGFSLSQILKALEINMEDFFKEMPQFVHMASNLFSNIFGSDWGNRLQAKELQENFWNLKDLSKQYKSAFQKFFFTTDVNNGEHPAVMSERACVYSYQRFGWLLLLALRIHASSHSNDLLTCTDGLVSILVILILHVPVHFRKFSLCDYPLFVSGDKGVDLIASLCNIYHTSQDEVRRIVYIANYLIVTILKKGPCSVSECKAENLNNLKTDNLIYFEDLMEGQSLSSSLLILENDYADSISDKAELDERVFVNYGGSLLGAGRLSGGTVNITGTKRKFDVMASPTETIAYALSPPFSPVSCVDGDLGGTNFKMAPTTVKTEMPAATWLQTVISSCPPKPCAELELFLSSCDKNLTNDISNRATIILEAIFLSSTLKEQRIGGSLWDDNLIWAKERRIEALKLYYRVLEKICKSEYCLFQGNNSTPLLSNERFHRCLLACSAVIVWTVYTPVTMLFPSILERTGITAFDLIKVIESFVIHEETLPKELKMRINSLEERLLESMAWEKGSSMYNSLIVVKPALSAEINHLGLLAEPMPSLDVIAMHENISIGDLPSLQTSQKDAISPDTSREAWSPKRVNGDCRCVLVDSDSLSSPAMNHFQSAFLGLKQQITSGREETCAKMGIHVFFTKIMKLAHVRIKTLCQRLNLSEQFWESVCCLVQQILDEQTGLFFNRHVDQIILCSFFMIAKDLKLSLTFKEIIKNYRKQVQCTPHVLENVFVDSSSTMQNARRGLKHVDLSTFYNEIFVLAAKKFLKGPFRSLAKRKTHDDRIDTDDQYPSSPQPSLFSNLPDMSPKKVCASQNVYVSPLRFVKMDTLLSSGSRSHYAFIGESISPYKSHSKDLSVINDRLNCCRKVVRRLFD